jgi:photosystem II stability/assembly factor-like uncharacterized protein
LAGGAYFLGEYIMKRSAIVSTILSVILVCPVGHAQWESLSVGNAIHPWYISGVAFDGANLFVGQNGVNGGVFRSSNAGKTWAYSPQPYRVRAVAVAGKGVFAGTEDNGVFLSTDSGTSWTNVSNGLPRDCGVLSLTVSGNNLVAGCIYSNGPPLGVYLSSDGGRSWVPGGALGGYVMSLFSNGSVLLAGTLQGVYRSLNDGLSWARTNSEVSNHAAGSFAAIGTNLFAGTEGGGIFLSTDKGASWTSVHASSSFGAVAAVGASVVVSDASGGVIKSNDNGATWIDISEGMPSGLEITNLVTGAGYIFAGMEIGGMWRLPLAQLVTSAPEVSASIPQEFALMQNYPNPFNPSTRIKYTVGVASGGSGPLGRDSRFRGAGSVTRISVRRTGSGGPERQVASAGGRGASHISLVVYDLLGREVAVLVNEEQRPGFYTVEFDGSRLASGTYFYRLVAGSYVDQKKLLLLK